MRHLRAGGGCCFARIVDVGHDRIEGSHARQSDMNEAVRHRVATLTVDVIPVDPGVYGRYRETTWQCVGKASLRDRLWGDHLGQCQALSSLALRRTVAELFGFGAAAAIKRREVTLSSEQLSTVRAWLVSCELAWLNCRSAQEAIDLGSGFRPSPVRP